MKKILILTFTFLSLCSFGQGYLHRSGQNIVDGNGQNVLLRGLGLGGWMVQEGYMLQTSAFAGPQHVIKQKITDLIGPANTEAFYQAYRDNGITKRDIDSLKAWGFNSVRLPMHYNLYTLPIEQETGGQNTWLEEGFERTDALLDWCAQNEMYLILDMHATPGGQGKDSNISDYDPTKPSLWESEANRTKLIALWRQLADRYKNSPWIGAYDLINEPNWNFTGTNQNGCDEGSNAPLRSLMIAITSAIREVDTNHMIIAEGNCWGNNYNGILTAGLWDTNMALSFHKYWNYNTTGSIQNIMNLRTQYNVPIWLGESGENSNVWFKDAISLIESNNIGWAWWPMKKIESIAGISDVEKTPEYQQLLNYWSGNGPQPTQAFATTALMQIAEGYKIQNTTIKYDVLDAMFRQIQTTETKKFKNHPLPGKVYATEYDLGQNGYAYSDTDIANYQVDAGAFAAWNKGYSMRNDGVDIEACADAQTNGFQVAYIAPNEWLTYTLTAAVLTAYDVDIRYAGIGGKVYLEDANGKISETIIFPSSGGMSTWATATLTDVLLQAGENKVKIYFEAAGFNLNFLEFKNPHASNLAVLKVIDASTTILGDKVTVVFNKNLQSGIDFSASNLTLKVNGNTVALSSVAFSGTSLTTLQLKPANPINAGDVVTLTYAGTNIIATDATIQSIFTDKPVTNKVGNILGISGTIQAEQFYANSGLTLETTSDVGGGSNIAFTDPGDYLDYLVNISQTGNYKIDYRTSGLNATGSVKMQLINDTTLDVQTVTLPPTGGWQTWQTTSTQAPLPAGRYILRIRIEASGFNLNWVRFSFLAPDDDNDNVENNVDTCPNTPAGDVVDFNGCTLFSLTANNFTIKTTSETCRTSNNGSIEIDAVANHGYVATLTGTSSGTNNFNDVTTFSNLAAGNYSLCITIPAAPMFQRCFDVVITEPHDLSVLSRVSSQNFTVRLTLEGSELYTILLNDIVYTTQEGDITLDLQAGNNELTVKADQDCQGIYKTTIAIDDKMMAYPNPTASMLYVTIPVQKNERVSIAVFSMLGKSVLNQEMTTEAQTVAIDMTALATGTYALRVTSDTATYNKKIVKQ